MTTTDPGQLVQLSTLATAQALRGDWEAAISTNKQIVKADPENIDALNRLGHAYTEAGMIARAMTAYRGVLKHDRYNGIATRNLKRLKAMGGKNQVLPAVKPGERSPNIENLFLEVAGKTATVNLVNLAEPKVLARINCADNLILKVSKHQVALANSAGAYIGKLPDLLAARLIRLVTGGNKYEAFVKGVSEDQVRVFLRETRRAKRLAMVNSFPIDEQLLYVAFTPPDMVHGEMPEARTLEEQAEAAEGGGEEEDQGNDSEKSY